ncbi:hypothetical protein BDV35DRAFT_350407 [Aspergillus flavus]|uniref:Uncharacterized protein n=1 Tax=Aspergillus flavus TaxID=5059 RepID=A0A5N6H0C8_ASPFL|nr:hypothetical protein BDV35DRAFT_350407 [Aspergillus flavus]
MPQGGLNVGSQCVIYDGSASKAQMYLPPLERHFHRHRTQSLGLYRPAPRSRRVEALVPRSTTLSPTTFKLPTV